MCNPDKSVSFNPGFKQYDIAIRLPGKSLYYDLTNTPAGFLDVERNKRLILVFGEDHKLYLLRPTDKPLEESVSEQPAGWPLVPK